MLGYPTMLKYMTTLKYGAMLKYMATLKYIATLKYMAMLWCVAYQIILFSKIFGAAADTLPIQKVNKMWTVGCFYGTGEELIEKSIQRQ